MTLPGRKPSSVLDPLAFLSGGKEMGRLIRSMDWSKTSLGPVADWPQSLRTTVSICLASDLPICVIWGPGLVQLYNDAYRVICGGKHPRSMGQNFSECWKEAWPVIGEAHNSALSGEPAFLEVQPIFLERHGFVEECFFTFSFSPIRDEAGRVGGLFHPVIEMTTQMLSERRTRALRDLAAQTGKAKSVGEALALAAQTLAQYDLDLPFTLFYAVEPGGDEARLIGATGLDKETVASPSTVLLGAEKQSPWPLWEVVRTGSVVQIDNVKHRLGTACLGPYPEPPDSALAFPIISSGIDHPVAIFVAGISARLLMNDAYRDFYDLVTSSVTSAVSNARAHEEERRRANALADLDRAKTAFVSNVSHEFRTPLTLMLGPVEDALAAPNEQLLPLQREQMEVVYRNGLRLQRLVNSLLDFSRIEAGRVRATYEPTALADLTTDLASNFRAACEKAGLKLRIDCPSLSEPVLVDRPMWEKIVLNLLSNAFKFTFEGEITVSMRLAGSATELRVQDTGTGIAAGEIPLLFERFHRIDNARGRTHEGSGIGLALVQELVKLHGGSISVESEVGVGTTFTVSIPLGSQHLPHDQLGSSDAAALSTLKASPFVEEALRWLPDADPSPAASTALPQLQEPAAGPASPLIQKADDDRPLVLVADDNADMRKYIVRLLAQRYRTEAVPDGESALAAARARVPDLILTDVMMPRLDGFGLLQALRADPLTSGVPVIMLSARAGEESRIDGMQEGAVDYLVKPFSARELLARVTAHLQMAQMRRESGAAIQASEEQFRALVSASADVVYRMNADWTEMRHLHGREFIADTHEPNCSWLEKYIHPDDRRHVLQTVHDAILTKSAFELEHRVLQIDGTLGWTFSRAIPLMAKDGRVVEWLGMASDATARKHAQQALKDSEQKFRTLFNSMDEGYCLIEMIFDADARPTDYRFLELNPAFEKHTGLRNAQGRRIREIAPDNEAHWFETYGRVAVTGVPIRFVNQAKELDGRWFDVYAFRLGGNGSNQVAILFTDISHRKASEDALKASENRSRTILESITDGFYALDADWRFTYINTAGERILERAKGELIGKRVWEVYPGAVGSEFEQVYRRVASGQGSESITAHYSDLDRWFELTAYPAPQGLSVYFRDVTEQKQIEERLRASEERRRLALEAAELGTWHVEPLTRATKTDARYRAIFGTTQEWTDYFKAIAVIHPDDQPAVLQAVAAATRLDDPIPYAIEYRIVHPDGSLHWVFAKGRSTFEGGGTMRRVVSFDGTVADITDRKRGEEERERLVACLQDQDRRKDEFLATLAHELRNPLAPIRNGLQIMRLAPGNAEATERIHSMMERQLGQMVHLIDDLLDLSRISRGKIDLRKERIELGSAIAQAVETSRPLIALAEHELLIELPPGPIFVDADLTRLTQIFSNLLNNAAKFTARGGQLRLAVELVGADAVISVTDNGIGIPTQMLAHVFEMFTQVEGGLQGSQGGLGIGLSIVQRLVQMHGGSVEARSEGPGTGSKFVVRLPVALQLVGNKLADEANPDCATKRLRILVADDNVDSAESLAMLLTLEGNETQTAHDGLQALDVAATFRPDAILLDIGMPMLNGYEVCRRLRQQVWGKTIVVIALTGWGQEEDKRRSLEVGIDFHLVKPVDHAALKKLLSGVTDSRAKPSRERPD